MKNKSLFIVILFTFFISIIWLFPVQLKLIQNYSEIDKFRNSIKDFAGLFYIAFTLWLVLLTGKMAEISLNAQKAINCPQMQYKLIVSDEQFKQNPLIKDKSEFVDSTDARFSEEAKEVNIFLFINNLLGGGKAVNIEIDLEAEVRSPDKISFSRRLKIAFLSENHSLYFYLYGFDKPSSSTLLKIIKCDISYTTPFDEAAKERRKSVMFNDKSPIKAEGNQVGAIKYGSGILI